jgi:riboflavin biosynthesis pyrimidine reductase
MEEDNHVNYGKLLWEQVWTMMIGLMDIPIRRLSPTPARSITIAEAYQVDRLRPPDRPWIGLCMVSSLDGSIAVGGSSGGLGNPNDLEVLLTLRKIADVVIVGAGTVRGEGYGPPKKPGQRIAVATNSGSVDLSVDLFTSGAGFVLAPESATIDETKVDVLRAGRDRLDLRLAVERLDEMVPGVRHVQAEGGARLNGSLLDADLIDELSLTVSPKMVGGAGPRVTVGAIELDRNFSIGHVLSDTDGFIFTRWLRKRPA